MFSKAFLVILTLISLFGDSHQIVGGKNAVEGQFPWAVALFRDGKFICTASIISPRSILTAASCVYTDNGTAEATTLHGIANLRKSSPTLRIEFSRVVRDPEYSQFVFYKNIALLVTKEPVVSSSTVRPVCIANENTGGNLTDKKVIAMGWGDTSRVPIVAILPDILQYLEQSVDSTNYRCFLGHFRSVDPSQFCAGSLLGGICNGDNGGPLVYSVGGTPVQVGIATYGNNIGSCVSLLPVVYTRVSAYTDFIKENAADPDDICFA